MVKMHSKIGILNSLVPTRRMPCLSNTQAQGQGWLRSSIHHNSLPLQQWDKTGTTWNVI